MEKLRTPNLRLYFAVIVCVLQTFVSPEQDIALKYLQKFGYIPKPTTRTVGTPEKSPGIGSSDPNGDTPQTVKEAVKSFQEFAGLAATGELDEETLELMSIPRCGVEDVIPPSSGNSSNYQVPGSRWRKKTLSYRVTLYSQKMPAADVDADVKRAFNFWSAATNLNFFNKRSGDVDIELGFVYKNHEDGNPFDGPGGTLAHAYFPENGDVHMDESENWTKNTNKGINFLQTLTHEIGHSLGLSHSRVSAAVMAPFYRGWNSGFKLHTDDILGVQSLYGKPPITTKPPIVFPTAASTTPPTTTTNRPPKKGCPEFDTNTQGREGAQRIDGIRSWSACSLKCSINKDCKYWTWHHEKATGFEFRCVLMSDFVKKAEDSNTISGSPDCTCPLVGINTQARQNAKMIGLESSWQGCARKCSISTKCSHWTWHPDSAGAFARRCVHMSGYANLAEDENTVSGSKNCS